LSGRRQGHPWTPRRSKGSDQLNQKRPDRRLLALAIGTVAAFVLVSCGPFGPPTEAPQGRADSGQSAAIPRPDQATVALGPTGPGYDGSSDFLSFASQLSPDTALSAYVSQLLAAGYRAAGRQGGWLVFADGTMTVWVRAGSAGPPTTLVVRYAQTAEAGLADPTVRPRSTAPASGTASGTGTRSTTGGTKPGQGATSARRPDPPHAAGKPGTVGPAGETASGSSGTDAGHPGPASGDDRGSGATGNRP
jgi:hypothetical protein